MKKRKREDRSTRKESRHECKNFNGNAGFKLSLIIREMLCKIVSNIHILNALLAVNGLFFLLVY